MFNVENFMAEHADLSVPEMICKAYEEGMERMSGQSDVMDTLDTWDEIAEDSPDEYVNIDGVVNVKAHPISNYEVKLAHGDLKLIVAMIRDYVKGFDQMAEDGDIRINPIEYQAYYRGKFMKIADGISAQIEYDYDKQLKKCLKSLGKESKSDVGGEALSLALKRR